MVWGYGQVVEYLMRGRGIWINIFGRVGFLDRRFFGYGGFG